MATGKVTRAILGLLALSSVVTLRFTTPTRNADGTPCTDLDSMLLYSTAQGRVKAHAQRDTGASDSFTTTGQGGYYFVVSKDRSGNLSEPSNLVRPDSASTADVPETAPVQPARPQVHDRCGGGR